MKIVNLLTNESLVSNMNFGRPFYKFLFRKGKTITLGAKIKKHLFYIILRYIFYNNYFKLITYSLNFIIKLVGFGVVLLNQSVNFLYSSA